MLALGFEHQVIAMNRQLIDDFESLQLRLNDISKKANCGDALVEILECAEKIHQKMKTLAESSDKPAQGSEKDNSLDFNTYAQEAAAESEALQLMLMRERSLLRSMIDLIPANIFAKDKDSKFLAANTRVARGMGCTPDELIGKTDFDFFPREMAQPYFDDEQNVIQSGQALIDREEPVLDKTTGETRIYLTSKVPVRDYAGTVIGTVGIGLDVTAQRENERKQRQLQEQLVEEIKQREQMALDLQLAQKLESVGRLAAGVAHEINTPIQFVNDSLYFLQSAFDDMNGLLEICRNVPGALAAGEPTDNVINQIAEATAAVDLAFLQEEIPKAFGRTFDGANRVANIVRAMKEFSHPDSSGQSSADINEALQTTLIVATNEYKYVAQVVTNFGELPLVICNIGELNQVFLNMIVNAAHAIHDSGKDTAVGTISITTRAIDDEWVEISFSDNGCGIPKEHIEKIYDPFFTTKEVGRGTGQGLAITRSIIIEKHGGTIQVDSTVGEGTKFILALPVHGRPDKEEVVA